MRHAPSHDALDLCARAGTLLRSAGFEFRHASMKSEATYYGWPGERWLIRVAAHRQQREGDVIAAINFTGTHLAADGTMDISDEAFLAKVAHTIGFYFLRRGRLSDSAVVPDEAGRPGERRPAVAK